MILAISRPATHDLYIFQELHADGSEKGAPEKLSYFELRVRIGLCAPSLSKAYVDHVFMLAHAAKGGPVEIFEWQHIGEKERGVLKFSARLSRVVP